MTDFPGYEPGTVPFEPSHLTANLMFVKRLRTASRCACRRGRRCGRQTSVGGAPPTPGVLHRTYPSESRKISFLAASEIAITAGFFNLRSTEMA